MSTGRKQLKIEHMGNAASRQITLTPCYHHHHLFCIKLQLFCVWWGVDVWCGLLPDAVIIIFIIVKISWLVEMTSLRRFTRCLQHCCGTLQCYEKTWKDMVILHRRCCLSNVASVRTSWVVVADAEATDRIHLGLYHISEWTVRIEKVDSDGFCYAGRKGDTD